ncbi:hypothetical protein KIH23_11260 [Flavobacterium sp. CYK-55]|uniref:hypothetical protein n=1 Tax=Flavobacterium sp. CYK-55 TaxID=2835529 RepID=UPI001BCDB066|nr:hypothetical protein [Flavobacterium sp. CYK-55]MBS7787874.1 hypothetical protein [Flavobacterium sp. CYK-55]
MVRQKKSNSPDWFDKFENTIQFIYDKKLWIFAGGLFITSITFIINIFWQISATNANINEYNALNHQNEMTKRKVEVISKGMKMTMEKTNDAINYYQMVVYTIRDKKYPIDTILKVGRHFINESQIVLDAQLSVLSSIYFSEKEYDKYTQDFVNDLNTIDDLLIKMDIFFEDSFGKNEEQILKYYRETNKRDARKLLRTLNNIEIRQHAFKSVFERSNEIRKAELEKLKAPIDLFGIKASYILGIAAAYCGFFIYFVIKKFRRTYK